MPTTTFTKAKIYLSYASQDETYKNKILTHLKNLERQGYLETWNASQLLGGQEWDVKRQAQLEIADIVLLLISSDAIADDYIHDKEIQKVLQNARNNKIIVVPILIRPVDYQGLGIEEYLVLPSNGKAINEWNNPDKAYRHIVHQIRKIIEKREEIHKGRLHLKEVFFDGDDTLPQDDPKTRFWQYLTTIGLIIGILASIYNCGH